MLRYVCVKLWVLVGLEEVMKTLLKSNLFHCLVMALVDDHYKPGPVILTLSEWRVGIGVL